ncbi:hypothetical protein AB4K08_00945 [Serratia fonticola]|uniref:hypothetical protein n=1 Tax=Serratia fonticola TaxID=47917 RepID=UPI0034C69EEF
MDKQTESRFAFEAEFRQRHSFVPEASMAMMLEQYNFGTDEEPDWGYYSLAARDAWEWWKASRDGLVVELPIGVGRENDGIKECAKAIRAIGIRIKGEGV